MSIVLFPTWEILTNEEGGVSPSARCYHQNAMLTQCVVHREGLLSPVYCMCLVSK